ncbi:hypothetical protein NCCP2716_14720 [Sporosarcina sp. NCCP-2716]|uniref:hypothetical protein n=1 Tax=Sporosarcina sp. NCCP-2716 TaxID=2943679 RepID=UPI00203EB39E|nr:hypothetical protein [Sporosarcina sp. NCCP-2716]GKV68974.1 hypothetical protein NCCP2716_14720 [Sporosarcina sp. NCCP-2716]
MKKPMILLAAGLLLAACSNTDNADKPSENDTAPAAEQPAEQNDASGLEEGLKGDTEKVELPDVASGDVPANKKVNFTGTVFAAEDGKYGLKADVTDAAEDVLWVDDLRLGERTEIPEGTEVTVYGSYTEKDDQGVPVVKAVFIDTK